MKPPVTSPHHRRPKSPRARPQRTPLASTVAGRADVAYAPPQQRLNDAYDECARLDRELQVIENSGHAKLGVFAKPLGEQQRCRLMAAAATHDKAHHLPEDPVTEPAFIDDDDVTSDPFFHRFYDEQGRSAYEQLLRARMRILALAKMVHTRQSVAYARAEVELAETYARMNLWKQAHAHGLVASEVLTTLDEASAQEQHKRQQHQAESDDDGDDTTRTDDRFGHLLAFFYARQLHGEHAGEITKPDLLHEVTQWHDGTDATGNGSQSGSERQQLSFDAIVAPSNLDALFGAAPFLHWQQLLLRMERQSAMFQDYVRGAESRVPQATRTVLRGTFTRLDPSQFGVVPLHSLLERLETTVTASENNAVGRVCAALRRHDARVEYPCITWSELVQCAAQSLAPPPTGSLTADPGSPARDLRPRLKFLFGRFGLRKGQLDDAMRYMQTAIAEHERVHGSDSATLVPLYLVMAETLSVRFKQLAVVAQQHAFEVADKWLQTTDGSRRLRAKALDVVELASHQSRQGKATLPSKKDAEAQAREELLKEYAALSFVRPDATMIEDAVELCSKAWRLQEETHGRDHITTASVHVTLAQIHAIHQDYDESVRCYEQAIAIIEAACNGPVPASAWLKLAIAKLLLQANHTPPETSRTAEAAVLYDQVGDFFHSFALEFAGSDATRRESCGQAIDAWRQWLAVSSTTATMDDRRRVLTKLHDATIDGRGEFAVETAESGRELGQLLIQMGQLRPAERHLRAAWYVLESHFGPNDRRSRRARKELVELSSELKGAALHDDDGGHEWLTI